MTRANAEQSKYVPWFAKAGAACSIVPIARFVNDHIFALKGGGYGCLLSLAGVDEEGLTDQELESQLRMIEGSLRGLPEGACLYQYARVRSGYRRQISLRPSRQRPNPLRGAESRSKRLQPKPRTGAERLPLRFTNENKRRGRSFPCTPPGPKAGDVPPPAPSPFCLRC
jgi:hypothetical protein